MSSEAQAAVQPKVSINGAPLGDDVAGTLTSLVVEDDLRLPDSCLLRFEDGTADVLDRLGAKVGGELTVAVATESESAGQVVFDGEITALEAQVDQEHFVAVIRGYDRTHRLQRGTHTETYLNVTASDVVSRIAERHGLQTGRVDATSTQHGALVQWNRSDWDFLQCLAAEAGREINFSEGKLVFQTPLVASAAGSGSPDTASATEIVAGRNLLRLRATVNSAAQASEVAVVSWDGRNKKEIRGLAPVGKAAGAQTATDPASLSSAFGSPKLTAISPSALDVDQANDHASAIADRLASVATELDGETPGNPSLRAGTPVKVSGVGAQFDGSYRLTACVHRFDLVDGYITEFRVHGANRRDLLGLLGTPASQGGAGLVTGVVSNNDDPEKMGRVKVAYTWLDERVESDWSRVVCPGAGGDRGLVALPEVGDEVAVGFHHADPRRAYVLGGLFSSEEAVPEITIEGGEVPVRVWRSRDGHRVELNDRDDEIVLSADDDSVSLVLSKQDSKVTITSSGEVVIEAERDVSFVANGGVSFEAGGQLTLKGVGITLDADGGAFEAKGTTAKVEGSGTAELSGGASTTISGALVRIN